MKNTLFIVALFIAVNVFAQDKTVPATNPAGKGPVITFITKDHDFGKIEEGTQAKFDFEFTNTGDQDLVLTNVHPSCGCTTPTWTQEPVKPGAKGKVSASFNSTGYSGQNFQKSITVTTNAKENNVEVLYFHGSVVPKPTTPTPPPTQNPPAK